MGYEDCGSPATLLTSANEAMKVWLFSSCLTSSGPSGVVLPIAPSLLRSPASSLTYACAPFLDSLRRRMPRNTRPLLSLLPTLVTLESPSALIPLYAPSRFERGRRLWNSLMLLLTSPLFFTLESLMSVHGSSLTSCPRALPLYFWRVECGLHHQVPCSSYQVRCCSCHSRYHQEVFPSWWQVHSIDGSYWHGEEGLGSTSSLHLWERTFSAVDSSLGHSSSRSRKGHWKRRVHCYCFWWCGVQILAF